jgi:UDP-glucose 4-epimerase
MAILVTGGAGYIGSHTCIELLNAGYEVVVADSLLNSKAEALQRVRQITDRDLAFYEIDLLDEKRLKRVFSDNAIEAVIHFAGLKAVGESVHMPLRYYQNNITGTLVLLKIMRTYGVRKLVFSSSATVYGMPERVHISEDFPLSATNPYGRTKLMIEEMLRDLHRSDGRWGIAILRYFNPIGAHKSGRIGEDPGGIPNNLMPYITQVAAGKRERLNVFGRDYPTPDGTGIRDYIHVADLAAGHLHALRKIVAEPGADAYNLGTGRGYSVLEMVAAMERASGRRIPYSFAERRPGDVAVCFADPAKAQKELGWTAVRDIAEMCEDSWRWQMNNPDGYQPTPMSRILHGTSNTSNNSGTSNNTDNNGDVAVLSV